jgi:adenylate cyclase
VCGWYPRPGRRTYSQHYPCLYRNPGIYVPEIGINTGPLVAGVVGKKKYAYDIWGSTVNIASRMESNCEPGRINISAATYELVKSVYHCTHRGKIFAKNIGEVDMYFVDRELEAGIQ